MNKKVISFLVLSIAIIITIIVINKQKMNPKEQQWEKDGATQRIKAKEDMDFFEQLMPDTSSCSQVVTELPNNGGIEMQIYYPCKWKDITSPGEGIVKEIGISFTSGTSMLLSVGIVKYSIPITPEIETQLLSKERMIEISNGIGEYKSSSNIVIDGKKAVEVFISKRDDKNRYVDGVTYIFCKNDHMILLSYSISSIEKKVSEDQLSLNKERFKGLALRTVL